MKVDELKKALISASSLTLSDSDGEFEIITDTSEDVKALGVALTQNNHLAAYELKKLNPH